MSYVDYIEPKYRDNAPRVVAQPDGSEAFVVPGMKRPVALGFIDGAGFSIKERNNRAKTIKFADIREAAYGGPGSVIGDFMEAAHEVAIFGTPDYPGSGILRTHGDRIADHVAAIGQRESFIAQRFRIFRDRQTLACQRRLVDGQMLRFNQPCIRAHVSPRLQGDNVTGNNALRGNLLKIPVANCRNRGVNDALERTNSVLRFAFGEKSDRGINREDTADRDGVGDCSGGNSDASCGDQQCGRHRVELIE
jgi:hypothetical protein